MLGIIQVILPIQINLFLSNPSKKKKKQLEK